MNKKVPTPRRYNRTPDAEPRLQTASAVFIYTPDLADNFMSAVLFTVDVVLMRFF